MIEEKTDIWYGDLPDRRARCDRTHSLGETQSYRGKQGVLRQNRPFSGEFSHTVWTTDLTEEYVRFNLGE